jgi:MFS family permease
MFGPLIGAYFASNHHDNINVRPAQFAISLTLIELFIILFALPETLPPEKRLKKLASKSIGDYVFPASLFNFKVLSSPSLRQIRSLGWIYFVYLFLYSGFEFTISFLTHSRFNYTSADQGKMYFITGILMTFIQGMHRSV